MPNAPPVMDGSVRCCPSTCPPVHLSSHRIVSSTAKRRREELLLDFAGKGGSSARDLCILSGHPIASPARSPSLVWVGDRKEGQLLYHI